MIRQNRAVPVMLLLTLGFFLWVGGCLDSEGDNLTAEEIPTPVPTSTPERVVSPLAEDAPPPEEPFVYTIEEGDTLGTIAAKFNVEPSKILLANPGINPSVLFIGQEIKVPGATTEQLAEVDPASRPEGEPIDYVVASGDTVGAIANTYLVSLDALLAANPAVDPNALQIDQLLTVPPIYTGLTTEQIAALSGPQKVDRDPFEVLEYVVEAGDLLSSLAEAYSVTQQDIMTANSLTDPNEIYVGQRLLIPPPQRELATNPEPGSQAEPADDAAAEPEPTVGP